MFYEYLVNTTKKETNVQFKNNVLSPEVERAFFNERILRFMNSENKNFFTTELIEQKFLFADFVCKFTDIDSCNVSVLGYLYTTLLTKGFCDMTPFMKDLRVKLNRRRKEIYECHLIFILSVENNKKISSFLSSRDLISMFKSKDSSINIVLQNFTKVPFALRNHYTYGPIINNDFVHTITDKQIVTEFTRGRELWRILKELEQPQQGSIAVTDLMELTLYLTSDFNKEYVPIINKCIQRLETQLYGGKINSIGYYTKALLTYIARGNGFKPDVGALKKIDAHFKTEQTYSIPPESVSSLYIFFATGLIDKNDMPNLYELSKSKFNPSVQKQRIGSSSGASISEVEFLAALKKEGITDYKINQLLLDCILVDILLPDKKIIEINGMFHYTTTYMSNPAGPSVITPENLKSNPSLLDHYRGQDAVKIRALCSHGYTYIAWDTSRYHKELAATGKLPQEIIDAIKK